MNSNKVCLSILGSSLFIVGGIGYFSSANLISSAVSTISKYTGGQTPTSPITVISIILAIVGIGLMIAALIIYDHSNEDHIKDHLKKEREALEELNPFKAYGKDNDKEEK